MGATHALHALPCVLPRLARPERRRHLHHNTPFLLIPTADVGHLRINSQHEHVSSPLQHHEIESSAASHLSCRPVDSHLWTNELKEWSKRMALTAPATFFVPRSQAPPPQLQSQLQPRQRSSSEAWRTARR
jgi:hypothetical protein